jgi:hypothetical protein
MTREATLALLRLADFTALKIELKGPLAYLHMIYQQLQSPDIESRIMKKEIGLTSNRRLRNVVIDYAQK